VIRSIPILFLPLVFAFAQEDELDPLEFRGFTPPSAIGKPAVFGQKRLIESPYLRLDQVLLENPVFGTYRRSDSSIAHPTSQGVSLRGTGTSAASRSIILLDGIPLNDPFGGWVRWNRFSLGELESVRFGQTSAFASSAGTIELTSRRPVNDPIRELKLATGDVHGFSADGFSAAAANKEGWDATTSFRMEDFAGHPVVRASQRGPIDEDAWNRMRAARASISRQLSFGRLTASLAGFAERRGNGTPLARNEGDGFDWSLGVENKGSKTILFGQEIDFASVFQKRASGDIALDQFSVPGSSLGFIHEGSCETGEHEIGFAFVALRRKGETNEDFADYKFRRVAGGRQTQLGLSLSDAWSPAEGWNLVASLRGDWFRDDQGRRKKWRLSNDAVLEDDSFPAREDFETGGSLQLSRKLTSQLAARATIRSRVRQPTLNELYRPYRVGNFQVDPNENLEVERITGIEVGIDWQVTERLFASFMLFQDNLRDSVANVSDPEDPNIVQPIILAQRINLDRASSKGLELSLEYLLANDLTIELKSLLVDTEVRRCPENSSIVGNRFAQAPNHRSTGSFSWTPSPWEFRLDARHESNRYDDARNNRLRLLEDFFTLDLSLAHNLSDNSRIRLSVNNLTDEEIQTARSSSSSGGIISTGAPRNLLLGLEWGF
jgi:outer membrane receptor protein involved in Fe transport